MSKQSQFGANVQFELIRTNEAETTPKWTIGVSLALGQLLRPILMHVRLLPHVLFDKF